jgi:hypothetical protein
MHRGPRLSNAVKQLAAARSTQLEPFGCAERAQDYGKIDARHFQAALSPF